MKNELEEYEANQAVYNYQKEYLQSKMDLEREKRKERTEFAGGKLSKLILVMLVISLFAIGLAISCKLLMTGIVAVVMLIIFGLAMAFGMKFLDDKGKDLSKNLSYIGLALVIVLFVMIYKDFSK